MTSFYCINCNAANEDTDCCPICCTNCNTAYLNRCFAEVQLGRNLEIGQLQLKQIGWIG